MNNLTLTKTQREAIDFCKDKNKTIIAIEPGCGKTISSLYIAKLKVFKKIYLITPPKLTSFDDDNNKFFDGYFDINKISHGVFKSDKKRPKRFKKNEKIEFYRKIYNNAEIISDEYIIIIDEAHKFKNIESTRTLALFAFLHKNWHRNVLMLTGTLRPNLNSDASTVANMCDLWFDLYKPCHNQSFDSFLEYCDNIEKVSYYFSPKIQDGMYFKRQNRHTDILYNKLKEITFFAEKGIKSKKIINYIDFDLTSMQKTLFRNMKGREVLYVGSFKANVNHQSKSRVRDGHLFLNHYRDNQTKEMTFTTNKMNYLKSIKNKSIIFTQFSFTAEYLAKELDAYCHTGKMNNKESKDTIDSFLSNKDKHLIATIDSLSTGFNLEECDQIIFYSFSYNYANFIQSFDRIHRIISTRDKRYMFLVYEDEKIKLNKALEKMNLNSKWLKNENLGKNFI